MKTAAQFTVLIERRLLQRLFAVFMTVTLLAALLGLGRAQAQPVSWGTRGKIAHDLRDEARSNREPAAAWSRHVRGERRCR